MNPVECKMKKEKGKMKRVLQALFIFQFSLFIGSGCRQKMAEQPYHRPLEGSDMFEDGRASRPLERGVVHRGQYLDIDPLVTGLVREEWLRAYAQQANPKVDAAPPAPDGSNRAGAIGSPRYDPPGFNATIYQNGTPHPGPQIYVSDFPFEIKDDDLKRRSGTVHDLLRRMPRPARQWSRKDLGAAAICTPTSFHTERMVDPNEIDMTSKTPRDVPHGYSRNYALWGIKIPMTEVPVGYYFEVITKGYAGMPSYSAQIPPADRWRIIAYIRVLQLSQNADAAKLPDDVKAKLNAVGGKP